MTSLKIIQEFLANHKAHGHYVDFQGWQLHKNRYYVYTKEYIRSNRTVYYGTVNILLLLITPCGEIECARCKKRYALGTNVTFGNEEDNLIYCNECNVYKKCVLKVESFREVDSFQHLPIKRIVCTSWSNKEEMMRIAGINVSDMNTYWPEIPCRMLPNGLLPCSIRQRLLSRRVVRRWRNIAIKRRVAYVLYKCIPNMDAITACALADRSVTCPV